MNFCSDGIWNSSLSWDTEKPHLTQCLKLTLTTLIPCGFLWIFLLFQSKSRSRRIDANYLNASKLVLSLLAAILTFYEIAGAEDGNEKLFGLLVKLTTFLLAAFLVHVDRIQGRKSSAILFIFWALFTCFNFLSFLIDINAQNFNIQSTQIEIYILMIAFTIFVLNFFADGQKNFMRECPKLNASFPSKIIFHWFLLFVIDGYRKKMSPSDFWMVEDENSSGNLERNFMENFRKSSEIFRALARTFWKDFLIGCGIKFASDILKYLTPLIIQLIIGFSSDEPSWHGFVYVSALFFAVFLNTFTTSAYQHHTNSLGLRASTGVQTAIYKKSMKSKASSETENLLLNHCPYVEYLPLILTSLWSEPFQVIIALYLLWSILGFSIIAGMIVMALLSPLGYFLGKKEKKFKEKQFKEAEKRIALLKEILTGIKVLKLYSWEDIFEGRILRIRNKEVKSMRNTAYVNTISQFIWSCAPFLMTLATFLTYVLIDENNVLDAAKAFGALFYFDYLGTRLSVIPDVVSFAACVKISTRTIDEFLNQEEIDTQSIEHHKDEKHPLSITDGTFSRDPGTVNPTLKDINLQIESGIITAIVGQTGCGKSSIISVFLGEISKHSGRVNVDGKIAYVSQESWIQEATLKDNILFGREMNKKFFQRVLDACELSGEFPDIEKPISGSNLSGGQRQRIALARAVYSGADIYLLDDPMSALDVEVAKKIFFNVLGPLGILQKKTRLLVTHNLSLLRDCNKIVLMQGGKIVCQGKFKNLLTNKLFGPLLRLNRAEIRDDDELKAEIQSVVKKKIFSFKDRVRLALILMTLGKKPQEASTTDENEVDEFEDYEQEERPQGKVHWSVYEYYLRNIGWLLVGLIVGFSLLKQGFETGTKLWLSKWTSDVETVNNSGKNQIYMTVYAGLGVSQVITTITASIIFFFAALNASNIIHNSLLKKVLNAQLQFIEQTPKGKFFNRFSGDVGQLDSGLPATVHGFIKKFIEILGIIFVVIYTLPILFVVILPICVIYFLIYHFHIKISRELTRLNTTSFENYLSHVTESMSGVSTIRAFKAEERFISTANKKMDELQTLSYAKIVDNEWLETRLELLGNFVIFSAALFAVIARDSLDPGLIGLVLLYAMTVTPTIGFFVKAIDNLESEMTAVERIMEFKDIKQEQITSSSCKVPDNWPHHGKIEFKKFSLRYLDSDEKVLDTISLEIKGGEKIGLVGRTGCGKTSLALSLFKLHEDIEGAILIDGRNISDFDLKTLRTRITAIPQEPILFAGTLRQNLDPIDEKNDEEIWKVLEQAHVKDFVSKSEGLSFHIEEGGKNLSIGQRQLVCLARALLRDSKILICDEITSSVDAETESLIQETLKTSLKHCTILSIVHHANLMTEMDKIVVLESGKIKECGSPDELQKDENSSFNTIINSVNKK